MYAQKEANTYVVKTNSDQMTTTRRDYSITKANREYTNGVMKATNTASNDTAKLKSDTAHDFKQREEEMIHEIKILEVELAKALFDLKKEYGTADGDVGVKHWLNSGGGVGFPAGAKRGMDSVKAMLTPGEFVISEPAVRRFGSDFFEKLNKMKIPSIMGFAEGGLVPGMTTHQKDGSITDTLLGTVNLMANGKQFPVKADLNLAQGLLKEFKKMGMSIA